MKKVIHIRKPSDVSGPIDTPQTFCGLDPRDKDVAWTSQEGARELFDGEIVGLEACPQCAAKGQGERV